MDKECGTRGATMHHQPNTQGGYRMSSTDPYRLNSRAVAEATMQWLTKRGVSIHEIAELAYFLQKEYYPELTVEACIPHVEAVLSKREVHNAVLTGIQLDMLAEQRKLLPPLQEILFNDEPLYGCDEILALSIVNVYGSIGLTNFGYIDKLKPGVVKRLNEKNGQDVHTFLDDLVGAIAAAAASRIAHRMQAAKEDEHPE
jgi:phosphatidylglycerophosphatase A